MHMLICEPRETNLLQIAPKSSYLAQKIKTFLTNFPSNSRNPTGSLSVEAVGLIVSYCSNLRPEGVAEIEPIDALVAE